MSFLSNWPIKRKLMLITTLASTLSLLVACGAFIAYEQQSSEASLIRRLSVTAEIAASSCAAGLSFLDPASVEQTLGLLSADSAVINARVYDANGKIFAQYQRTAKETPLTTRTLELRRGIELNDENLGTLVLYYDKSEQEARLARYLMIVLGVLGISGLFAFFLSALLQKFISKPVMNLARTVTRVAHEKNFSLRAPPGGADEIGSLIRGFNDMLTEIKSRDEELRSARENLEHRVEQRTRELAHSLSLLHSTLESSLDGMLAADLEGNITAFNTTLLKMWRIPEETVQNGNCESFWNFIAESSLHKEVTLAEIQAIQREPEKEAYGILELKDGRVLERYTKPQRVDGKCVGCVATFRDVTERKRSEDTLRRTEELYRRAIAGADAVPYAYDYRTRTYSFIGKGIESLIGYPPEEISPDLWKRIIQEHAMLGKTANLTKDEAARRVRTGELREWRCDMRVLTRSGEARWLSDNSVQNADEKGAIIGSMGILQDITDRKTAEAQLAYERDLLKALMENFPDSIYFKDLQSRFVRVSRSKLETSFSLARKLHAHSAAENVPPHLASLEAFGEWMLGRTDFDFFPEPRARSAYEDEQEIIRTGKPIVGKLESHQLADGVTRWSLTTKLPWRDKDGVIIGTFGASKDISELKDAEAKLEIAHRELVEISRHAGMAEVATNVLHNVGNVLNSVNTSAGVVSQLTRSSRITDVRKVTNLLTQNRDNLAGFLQSNGRIDQLIGFLKALSDQLESEKKTVTDEIQELTRNIEHIKEIVAMQQSYSKVSGVAEFHSLSSLLDDAIRVNAAGLVRHQVNVSKDYQQIPDLLLDKHKVLQILINLISNAKYALSDSDAPERRLGLSITADNGRVRVTVCDNGVGISQENITRIFAHGFTTRRDGHGFGLHSSALAAVEIGGKLYATSEGPGRGATFTLELPAQFRR